MCGLSGVAGNLQDNHVKAFDQLMYMNTLRGEDASGVASVGYEWSTTFVKSIGEYHQNLRYHRRFREVVTASKSVLIGHCRYGTMGGNKPHNAHPFRAGAYLGVHNGTLEYSSKSRLSQAIGGQHFDTDSETIFHHMDDFGVESTISKLEGAWALVFVHSELDDKGHPTGATLNFIRNSQRTLFIFISDDSKFMAWSSEYYMLMSALARNGIDVSKGKTEALPEDELWSFPIEKSIIHNDWSKVTKTKIEGFKKPPVVQTFQGHTQGKAYGYSTYDDGNSFFSEWSRRSGLPAKTSNTGKQEGVEETNPRRQVGTKRTCMPRRRLNSSVHRQ